MMKKICVLLFGFILLFGLTSCVPKTAYDAKMKLEKKGYEVEVSSTLGTMGSLFGFGELKYALNATKGEGETKDSLFILYFETNDDAKMAYELLKDQKNADLFGSTDIENLKISGKAVYSGTKKAVKDFD